MSVPNQRRIVVKRFSDKARSDYFKISNKSLEIAMFHLKGNQFKLYCYLCDNSNGYSFDLYPCDFQRKANVSYDTYKACFKALQDKGFLVPSKNSNNTFMFLEESKLGLKLPDKNDMIVSLDESDFEIEKRTNYT